jgi:hypothetical protein
VNLNTSFQIFENFSNFFERIKSFRLIFLNSLKFSIISSRDQRFKAIKPILDRVSEELESMEDNLSYH